MNEQNLRPLPPQTHEQLSEWGRKGGKVKSAKKTLGQRLLALKNKGLTDENCQRVYDILTDMDATDLDILLLIEGMRAKAESIEEKDRIARLYIKLREMRHGSKVHSGGDVNVQINIVDELKQFYSKVQKENVGEKK